ncbi:MAG: uracil phosphoribosyltransferase [Prevotellaceae bacterium]|jgi:uracil phosphoribosyltransferase|nr:uracil phosphoribosyltransferase [Prevotellaceae bacterium]
MIQIIGNKSSIFNQFMFEIRDVKIQKDRMRFRKNLERMGEIFAYEISKTLPQKRKTVETPLGSVEIDMPSTEIVLATILRAGLPLHQGMLNFFDKAENAFVSAYRKYDSENSFKVKIEYISTPILDNKTLIISDPMLATGASMHLVYRSLIESGIPEHTHIVSIIASRDGIEYIRKYFPKKDVTIWAGAIDDELTVKSYIVPGLGDAGDLAYGCKV